MTLNQIIRKIIRDHSIPLSFFGHSKDLQKGAAFKIINTNYVPSERILIPFLKKLELSQYDIIVLLTGQDNKKKVVMDRVHKALKKTVKSFVSKEYIQRREQAKKGVRTKALIKKTKQESK